jgi:hemoglobin
MTDQARTTPTIYESMGAMPAVVALAAAWHRLCLDDPVVAHAFHGRVHPAHVARLAAYWAEQLGGPPAYTGGEAPMGDHAGIVRAHSGNGPHDEMDARAIGCFVLAMDEAGLPDDERLRAVLTDWFVWATEHVNHDHPTPEAVPAGLPMPYWSWDGPGATGTPSVVRAREHQIGDAAG